MNPYVARAMIKEPAAFVGRAVELHDLYTLLAGMQNCSVVGPRRIGKSSLLYHLTHPSTYRSHLPNFAPYVFAFVDLQELAGLEPDDFFSIAVERLERASQGRLQADVERDGTLPGFRLFLMRATDAGLRLVLCCDEFEMLSQNSRFGVDFFTYLRGLCSNYNLALVTSSRASLYDLCHLGDLQTSQFWNVFVERTLGLMPEDEARTLISEPFTRAGGTITQEDVAFVLELAGCHPFFVQIACYHLFEARKASVQPDLPTVEGRFLDEARRYYAYAWEQLDGVEQTALATLAQIEGHTIDPTIFQQLKRNALVSGTPESPLLVSCGWRKFIESEVRALPTSQPPISVLTELPSISPPSMVKTQTVYTDFDLKVEQIDPTSCRVLVLDSPAGQDSVVCQLPFNLDQVGEVMVDLGRQISRGVGKRVPDGITPVTIGEALFRAVFSGAVGQLFFESLGRVHVRGQGLRMKIHVDPEHSPQLAALPWEFLYNYQRRSFLSLNRLTPIVRYLDVQAPTDRPRISPPLRVLVIIASPTDLPPLNLSRERALIQRAWGGQSNVSVDFLDAATPLVLQNRLWDWGPHVLHFMGHGHFDAATGAGTLLFVDEGGDAMPVSGERLGVLLSNAPSVRLAVLNACQSAELSRSRELDPFSSVAAALVMAGLPSVVAMQFPISDRAALAFANGFYPRLAAGEPVDVAVAFGREALYLQMADSQEWGTPVLFMRVSDGRLFEIEKNE
jgi:hypothetical protein